MHGHQPHLRESAKAGSPQQHSRKGRILASLSLLSLLWMLVLSVAVVKVLLLAVVVVVVVVAVVVQGSTQAPPRSALCPASASSRNAFRPARASPRPAPTKRVSPLHALHAARASPRRDSHSTRCTQDSLHTARTSLGTRLTQTSVLADHCRDVSPPPAARRFGRCQPWHQRPAVHYLPAPMTGG